MTHPSHRTTRLAAALILGTAAGVASVPVGSQTMDISQAPLASSSNLSVLPNILFVLDDSGSMMFDGLPDNAEHQQGGGERKYWNNANECKPRLPLTSSSKGNLDKLPATHCDRVDPPMGAVQYNGMYYNPLFTYRPPIKADLTSYPSMTSWNSVTCDPFASQWKCSDWYSLYSGYYGSGAATANEGGGTQNWSDPYVANWYGTSNTFDVQNQFPEIVYCTSSSGNVLDLSQCRRNGLTGDPRHTGNPFRYTTAVWGRGNTAPAFPPFVPYSGAYPESPPIHEFFRQSGSTTITVQLAYPLSGSGSTVKIIPRTGTGTGGVDYRSSGTCSNNVCTATVDGTKFKLTYDNGRNSQVLVDGGFDLVVALSRDFFNTVTVSNAYAHGLNVGDTIAMTETSCSTSSCGFTDSNVTVSQVVDSRTFKYIDTGFAKTGEGYYVKTNLFNYPKIKRGNPFYYTLEPVEHCVDSALTNCIASTTPSGAFTFPAPLRYCISQFDANRLDVPVGKDPTNTQVRCRKKYEEATGYIYPRYGQFRRVDIVSSGTFTNRPLRTDCPSRPNCSFTEEMTNFANWFAYYRHRMLMMKTAAGLAFSPIDDKYRVGFITINPGSTVSSSKYLKIDTFTPSQKQKWYDMFYVQDPGGGTPLTQALSRAGRHFAGKQDGINSGMNDDPVQYSCQQNFTILTTDGYWAGFGGKDLNGNNMGNVDNVSSKTPRPVWDGATDGGPQDPDGSGSDFSSSGTLADIALYYYQTDLRTTGSIGALGFDVSDNNVPTRQDPFGTTSTATTPTHQHMVTFGLGLAEGMMDWRSDYESKDATGDFDNVRKGAINACSWAAGTCNWPVPAGSTRPPANLDDLWHAAVNSRGKFFYARDTQAVQDGLIGALTSLQERSASGAAAATSTPNITPSDRSIFRTSYTTIQWNGEVQAQLIDPNDGSVLPGILWSAKELLQGRVGPSSDSRTIYIYDSSATAGIKAFKYGNLTGTEQAWFDNKCTPATNLNQCSLLDPATQLPLAQSGTNMVDFLRGQTQYEADIFRDRQFALGDTVNAVPLYIAQPRFGFGDAVSLPYTDWKELSSIKNRTPALYVGANDGMLHAFNANTGDELWAFIPRQVAPNMWKLADKGYTTKHQYYVDGSPQSMDVWDGSTWRTIVVGGLNAGGRGYYAIDVTNPNAPKALWEICSDSTLCSISDADMGYSFGNPIITKRQYDKRWVVMVTSGYNNVSPGNGHGYLYVLDALKGTVLQKIDTGVGNTTTPSGLGKISAWADNFFFDNITPAVYGGDQQGNIWKFDFTASGGKVIRLGQALDASNKPQPITTRPELGLVQDTYIVVYVATGRYLGVKDLTDPATQVPAGTWAWQQSIYAFKDLNQDYGKLRDPANKLVQQTLSELSGGLERTVSNNAVNWATDNGWYIDLNPGNKSPGERVNVDPQLVLGTLVVTTNVPGGGACAIGGDSWVYQFNYLSGSYVYGAPNNLAGVKQTGALTVGMVIYQLQKGSLVGQVQRSETSMIKQDINTAPGSQPSRRTSWREITPDLQ